jgi:hypothetical protein
MGSTIFPPESVTVFIGNSKNSLKQSNHIILKQPLKMEENTNFGLHIPITKGSYSIVKVIIKPVAKLPFWHSDREKKGRVLIDEIFFN